MAKTSLLLTCFLVIGSIGPSKAEPLYTSDTVFINGLPCNRACQSYMAWSQALSGQPAAESTPPQVAAHPDREAAKGTNSVAKPDRITKKLTSIGGSKPPITNVQAAQLRRKTSKSEADRLATVSATATTQRTKPDPTDSPGVSQIAIPPAQGPREVVSVIDSPSSAPSPTSGRQQTIEQAAPASKAQDPSGAVSPPEAASTSVVQRPTDSTTEKSADGKTRPADNVDTTSSIGTKSDTVASTNGPMVAVLLVRKELGSIADLKDKVVAIDASDAVSLTRAAIISAGATDVHLKEGETMALLRVMNGEVPAAVVALESPQQAATWENVPGFNVFRIPLAPSSETMGPG